MMTEINNPIEWIEEAISKKHIKYYKFDQFRSIKIIGSGAFGIVYRAKWKNTEQYLALKTFTDFNATAKEVVKELTLQRDVDFHINIIRFLGVTSVENNENNQNGLSKKYSLVMEYADGGTLREYLEENFNNLTWNDKYKTAYQLACAVSCLHAEEIVHSDLHSNNILIHQNVVKLSDFGLSKRIEVGGKSQSKLFGIIPYIDPNKLTLNNRKYKLNKSSDVYSIGVLLWEISRGQPPFYTREGGYDFNLALEIVQGTREQPVPGTATAYVKLYTECWNGEPNNRPVMDIVVDRLKKFITLGNDNTIEETDQTDSNINNNNLNNHVSTTNASTSSDPFNNFETNVVSEAIDRIDGHQLTEGNDNTIEESNQTDNNINNNNLNNHVITTNASTTFNNFTNAVGEALKCTDGHQLTERNDNTIEESDQTGNNINNNNLNNHVITTNASTFNNIESNVIREAIKCTDGHPLTERIDELVNFINKKLNEGNELKRSMINDYSNDHNINLQEIFYMLLDCQDSQDQPIFLFGIFNQLGIETGVDIKLAIQSYKKASDLNHNIAQCCLAHMYKNGDGVNIDHVKAFKLFEKSASGNYPEGLTELGICFEEGIGTRVDKKRSAALFSEAANLNNSKAQYHLGVKYKCGIDNIDKDDYKAFELFKESAKGGYLDGINMLGECYYDGIGTDIDVQKAFGLFQEAASLGNTNANYNIAIIYQTEEKFVNNNRPNEVYSQIAGFSKENLPGFKKTDNDVTKSLLDNNENFTEKMRDDVNKARDSSFFTQNSTKNYSPSHNSPFLDVKSNGKQYKSNSTKNFQSSSNSYLLPQHIVESQMHNSSPDAELNKFEPLNSPTDSIYSDRMQSGSQKNRSISKKDMKDIVNDLASIPLMINDRSKTQKILGYLKNNNTTPKDVIDWLPKNSGDLTNLPRYFLGKSDITFKEIGDFQKKNYPSSLDCRIVLGDFNYFGIGIKRNSENAFRYYLDAVSLQCSYIGFEEDITNSKNYGIVSYNLGFMYEYGEGTEKDEFQAIQWYRDSSRAGNKDAQNQLNRLLNKCRPNNGLPSIFTPPIIFSYFEDNQQTQ